MAPEFVTLEEIAKIFKVSKHTVYKNWHKWKGVRVSRLTENGLPRFNLADVLKMAEGMAR